MRDFANLEEFGSNENKSAFVVRFWGVRGSIPCPGPETLKYGGNTPCVEVRVDDQLLVFDGGTGIRNLGKKLIAEGCKNINVFLSHLHWDHIQGIPFFAPAFVEGNKLTFYGGGGANGVSLRDYLIGQMQDPHFPIPMTGLNAQVDFCDVVSGSVVCIGNVMVRALSIDHPGGALGYRVESRDRSLAYLTDNEPPEKLENTNILELAGAVDLLIYDAAYTNEEYYSGRRGWGHSTWQMAVAIAKSCRVRKLILFHHDPSHTDEFLDEVLNEARTLFPSCWMARECMTVDLIDGKVDFQ